MKFDLRFGACVVASILCIAVAASNLRSQDFYVAVSRGGQVGFNELRRASSTHLLDELQRAMSDPKQSSPVISDTSNIVLAKIESLYARGAGIMFPTEDFITFRVPDGTITLKPPFLGPSLLAAGKSLQAKAAEYFYPAVFEFTRDGACYADDFIYDARASKMLRSATAPLLLQSTPEQGILNRWNYHDAALHNVNLRDYRSIHNDLSLVVSTLARGYYFGNRIDVALFQLESDPFFPDSTMAGAGRYIFLRAVNPTKRARLEISYSSSLRNDGENRIPPISVAGSKRFSMPVVGSGSARVFSEVASPQIIRGEPFLELDLGQAPLRFPGHRSGLNTLYGKDVVDDSRSLAGFVRDISLVSEEDYAARRAPTRIERFPEDLANKNLEYSGAYESGWISGDSAFWLTQPHGSQRLAFNGMVPLIRNDARFNSRIDLTVDDKAVATERVGPGQFTIEAPVFTVPGIHKVEIRFSRIQHIPGPNPWPVGARLASLAFLPGDATANGGDGAGAGSLWEYGANWGAVEHYAGQTFRWIGSPPSIRVFPHSSPERLHIDLEAGPGVGGATVLHIVDSASRHEVERVPFGTRKSVNAFLPSDEKAANYTLQIEGGGRRTATDPRILNFRVFSIGIDRLNGTRT